MFDEDELARAVNLQKRSYELLKWVASAVKRGFISFNAAHAYSSASTAAADWIARHYQNIPDGARPSPADLQDFSGIFATYLENSFELVPAPGRRLYSPDAHCFCQMCSWLVDAPNLKAKSPSPKDKKRARKMMSAAISRAATENQVRLSEQSVETMLDDPHLRENLAVCAYGADLFQRMKGIAAGPAALVLWRAFAWSPSGAPKKKFELTAELIIEAEKTLHESVVSKNFRRK